MIALEFMRKLKAGSVYKIFLFCSNISYIEIYCFLTLKSKLYRWEEKEICVRTI